MELTNNSHLNNKIKTTTLLACTEKDYQDAIHDKIPDRWYNAVKRLQIILMKNKSPIKINLNQIDGF